MRDDQAHAVAMDHNGSVVMAGYGTKRTQTGVDEFEQPVYAYDEDAVVMCLRGTEHGEAMSQARHGLILVWAILAIGPCLLGGAAVGADPPVDRPGIPNARLLGHWEGHFELLSGKPEPVTIDLAEDGAGPPTGTLSVPRWGTGRWPLAVLSITHETVVMELTTPAGRVGRIELTGHAARIEGVYRWDRNDYRLRLTRDALDRAEVRQRGRPQVPKFPAPYATESVLMTSGDVTIAGGLCTPEGGPARKPALLLLPGSGGRAWDAEIPGRPDSDEWMWVLSDRLCRAGFVTLRLDSRGFGNSTGRYDASTMDDLVGDAASALAFLRGRRDIDPARVGIVGASLGGVVAGMTAARDPKVAALVVLSSPGKRLDLVFLEQFQAKARYLEASEEAIARRVRMKKELHGLVKQTLDDDAILSRMLQTPPEAGRGRLSPGELRQLIKKENTPMNRSQLLTDPASAFAGVRAPVLALQGDADLYVAPDNLDVIGASLKGAGNSAVRIIKFKGLGHSLIKMTDEAARANQDSIDPEVLDALEAWLRAALPGPPEK